MSTDPAAGGGNRIAAVAIAVHDLDQGIAAYEKLGFGVRERSPRGDWGIEAAILDVDNAMLELLAPVDLEKPAAQKFKAFLDDRGPGLYMLAIGVDDAGARYAELQEAGVKVPAPPAAAPEGSGVDGRFFWPSLKSTEGVMLEFIEGTA
jgi:catechol 2,3-dioxygenase-like lactoylglutathione lyase family enzyme